MILELAKGDAYGAGFEFASDRKIRKYNNLTSYHNHQLDDLHAGQYTDDTQMSLAIAELMIDHTEWTFTNIADKFVEAFKRDPRKGYAKGFYKFLESVEDGEEFMEKIQPDSERNGAAMRSAPLGFVENINDLKAMAEIQACTTHNTEIGVESSIAIALAAHYFIYDIGKKSHLTDFVQDHTCINWVDNWNYPVACCGEETVNAVLTVLKECNSLRDILTKSVAFSGDVDTVAALGMAIASLSNEYNKGLPSFLYDNLENGEYGREYLKTIDKKLLQYEFH
jgi:ADP-ribosylglycohydrolase